jgi:hypothetical protein
MSKTNFEYGTVVPQEFLNTIYGQGVNGGHVHDGVNENGHAKMIDPFAHIDGAYEGSFPVVFSSFSVSGVPTPQTVTFKYRRQMKPDRTDSIITLMIPEITGISVGTSFAANANQLPAALIPLAGFTQIPVIVRVAGENRVGAIEISNRLISFYVQWIDTGTTPHSLRLGSAFTDGVQKGIKSTVIQYVGDGSN